MSSVEFMREFISERLTAAAAEIFSVCEQTVCELETEIDRQRRLLDVWKPVIKLHRAELQHVCKEDEILTNQLLWDQDRDSSLDQDDPEPLQIKEEQQELCTGLDGEQLQLKQETESFIWTPACDESDHAEDHNADLSPDMSQQSPAEQQHVVFVSGKSSVGLQPNRERLLFHSHHAAKSQDQKGSKHGGSGSSRNVETRPRGGDAVHRNVSKNQMNAHTGKKVLTCDTCGKHFEYMSVLIKHQRIHTGERPFPCSTCGKRFSDLGNLKAHIKVHTGERLYSCHICGRDFIRGHHLKRHMRTHTVKQEAATFHT